VANRPPANTSFDGYASAELADPLASAVQGLHIRSNNPFHNPTPASTAANYNPFHPNGAAPANPFLDPRNRPASARPSRRKLPGYGSGAYSTNGGGGYLAPGQNPLQNPDRRRSGKSATPAVTSSRQERIDSSQRRPSSVAQPRQRERENGTRSAMGVDSSRSSAQTSVLPGRACNGMKLTRSRSRSGFKTLKPKEYRAFFKSGRVGVLGLESSNAHIYPRFSKPFTTKLMRRTTLLEKCSHLLLYGRRSTTASVCKLINWLLSQLTLLGLYIHTGAEALLLRMPAPVTMLSFIQETTRLRL
jgi:hypothetical protein